MKIIPSWKSKTIKSAIELTRQDIIQMFHGENAGLQIGNVITKSDCQIAEEKIKTATGDTTRKYKGKKMNIGTNLNVSSHWEFEYQAGGDEIWDAYFRKVKPTVAIRKKLFQESGDPIVKIMKILQRVWEKPVRIATHPVYDKQMYAGIIRSGAPKLHFDWARFDLPGMNIVAQAGANIPISNFENGGNLLIYRRYGMNKGNTRKSGEKVVGNYDLPHSMIEGVEMHEIHYSIGSLIIAPNRFLHEVTNPYNESESNRIILSVHVAWMGDGSLALFS